MTERPDPASLRASDQDREVIAERLRTAAGDGRLDFAELDERLEAAYRAKTYGELEPLVADLPGSLDQPVASRQVTPAAATQAVSMPVGGRPGSTTAVAIFGGATRKGRWVVPRMMQNFALFGGIELDLTDAVLEDREVTINAIAIFGGIDITVPDGVAVHTSGAGILGGFDGINDGGAVDSPVIRVTGVAIFGGVEVKRCKPKRARRSWHSGHQPPLPPMPPAPPLGH